MATQVVKTIGTSSRDYSTLQSWEDDLPSAPIRSRASTTQAGSTSSTIVLDTGASAVNNFYKGHAVWCDARSSEKRLITAYDGTTKIATIGSLNGSSATWDNTPGTEAFTVDEVQCQGEVYNDSEFTIGGTAWVLEINGPDFTLVSATAYFSLTAATGQSFQDHANVRTNALRYNASNGVGVRKTYNFSGCIRARVHYTRISRLQCKHDGTVGNQIALWTTESSEANNCLVKDCLVQSAQSTPFGMFLSQAVNVVSIAMDASSSGFSCKNSSTMTACVVLRPSDRTPAGTAVIGTYGTNTMRSCALFGFTTLTTGTWHATNSKNNATDLSSGLPGINNQHSVTYSQTTPFTDADKDSLDLRAIEGTALINNGFLNAVLGPSDISKTVRSDPPTIGAWEVLVSGLRVRIDEPVIGGSIF